MRRVWACHGSVHQRTSAWEFCNRTLYTLRWWPDSIAVVLDSLAKRIRFHKKIPRHSVYKSEINCCTATISYRLLIRFLYSTLHRNTQHVITIIYRVTQKS